MAINHHQDCDDEPLAHNTERTDGTVPVVIESPAGYPFEPGERERDWHTASDEEYAAYVTYWNAAYDRGE